MGGSAPDGMQPPPTWAWRARWAPFSVLGEANLTETLLPG